MDCPVQIKVLPPFTNLIIKYYIDFITCRIEDMRLLGHWDNQMMGANRWQRVTMPLGEVRKRFALLHKSIAVPTCFLALGSW